MKRLVPAFLLLTLSACGELDRSWADALSGRDDPARMSFITSNTVDITLGCVVAHMTDNNPFGVPFRGVIIQPNERYEVHPIRELMLGGEPIFLSVSRAGNRTLVEAFSLNRFRNIFVGLDEACG